MGITDSEQHALNLLIEGSGGTWIRGEYLDGNSMLTIKCKNGHVTEQKAGPITTFRKILCKNCINEEFIASVGGEESLAAVGKTSGKQTRRSKFEWWSDLQSIVKEKGGILHSDRPKGVHDRYSIECSHGHKWNGIAFGLLRGTWCQKCASSARRTLPELTLENMTILNQLLRSKNAEATKIAPLLGFSPSSLFTRLKDTGYTKIVQYVKFDENDTIIDYPGSLSPIFVDGSHEKSLNEPKTVPFQTIQWPVSNHLEIAPLYDRIRELEKEIEERDKIRELEKELEAKDKKADPIENTQDESVEEKTLEPENFSVENPNRKYKDLLHLPHAEYVKISRQRYRKEKREYEAAERLKKQKRLESARLSKQRARQRKNIGADPVQKVISVVKNFFKGSK